MNLDQEDYDRKVAEHWDNHTDATFMGNTYWLANEAIAARFNASAMGHREYANWVSFFVEHFLGENTPVDKVLNIGCGDGALDRHLASLDAASLIESIDIAPQRLKIAREQAVKQGMGNRISYFLCNAETTQFPSDKYDAIFFNSSLHHMSNLEALLHRCATSLKQDGYLFVNEYIGPNHYNFSDREKQVMQSLFQMLPEKYRISHAEHDRGEVRQTLAFPNPDEVKRVDPSEAICAEDIMENLAKFFTVEEFNFPGGTVQQFLFCDIAGCFRADDPVSIKLLDMICQIERMLVESGDLLPHFAIIILRPTAVP